MCAMMMRMRRTAHFLAVDRELDGLGCAGRAPVVVAPGASIFQALGAVTAPTL